MTDASDTSMAASPQDIPSPPAQSPLKFALAVVGHIGYLAGMAAMVVGSVFILLPLLPFPGVRRRLANAMLRRYLRFLSLRFLPAVRACRLVEVSYADPSIHSKPAVYVANHRSSIDAILLLGILPPTLVIIKARHARKIGYACLVLFFDFVCVEAGAPSTLRSSVDKCRALLAADMNLMVFPEGMRASSTRLMPFADFAFRMAIEHGVPIVPVVVHSDRPFLNRQKGSCFPPETVLCRIRFLAPVPSQSVPDAAHLSNVVWRRMSDELADMDRRFLKPSLQGGV